MWNGTEYVDDGSRYISMLWANGNHPDLYDEAGNLDRQRLGSGLRHRPGHPHHCRHRKLPIVSAYAEHLDTLYTMCKAGLGAMFCPKMYLAELHPTNAGASTKALP